MRIALSFLSAIIISCLLMTSAFCSDKKSESSKKTDLQKAYFAAGCFWKVQYIFSKLPGVVRTSAGYSGGSTIDPTYRQVCSNKTGHAETVQVEFDPARVSYHKLLEVFWANHDPTTVNRQGVDVGTQYRSAIFYTSQEQQKEALAYKQELEKIHKFNKPIVTLIEPASPFYSAEEYHQDYFEKHGMVCD